MSNSIWHDRYVELPEDVFANSVRPCVIAVDENKKFIGANYGLRGSIPEIKYWATVDDLIAQVDKAERLQKQLDSIKKYSDSLRHRVEKMLKKNKTLKNTVAEYFIKKEIVATETIAKIPAGYRYDYMERLESPDGGTSIRIHIKKEQQ